MIVISQLRFSKSIAVLLAFISLTNGYGNEIKKVSLPTTIDITRADIFYIMPDSPPRACLVMCPGINGNGQHYLTRNDLIRLANHYDLALVGLSFASPAGVLEDYRGYYSASQGAGQLLIDAVDQNIGKGLPMLVYGFSGGAHFASSFQEAYPKRVIGWCAYTAAWWEEPKANEVMPPGVVVCGKLDVERYDQSLQYFEKGRRLGKPWCWLSLAGTGHEETERLFQFIETYFSGVLETRPKDGDWYDLKTEEPLIGNNTQNADNAVWLPNAQIKAQWLNLHTP